MMVINIIMKKSDKNIENCSRPASHVLFYYDRNREYPYVIQYCAGGVLDVDKK
ncbi:MAG: hypothetical protein ACLSBH_21185 [Coprobacillus cateniformis]